MSDTPRMKAAQMTSIEHMTGDVYRVGCDIELELNAANSKIELLMSANADVARIAGERDAAEKRIKLLEAVTNDPHALWVNWLRGNVKLPVGIGDVRQYQDRIKRLEDSYAAKDKQLSNLLHICRDNDIEVSSYDLIHGRGAKL